MRSRALHPQSCFPRLGSEHQDSVGLIVSSSTCQRSHDHHISAFVFMPVQPLLISPRPGMLCEDIPVFASPQHSFSAVPRSSPNYLYPRVSLHCHTQGCCLDTTALPRLSLTSVAGFPFRPYWPSDLLHIHPATPKGTAWKRHCIHFFLLFFLFQDDARSSPETHDLIHLHPVTPTYAATS